MALLDCSDMGYMDALNYVYTKAKIDVSKGLKNLRYTLLSDDKTLEIEASMTLKNLRYTLLSDDKTLEIEASMTLSGVLSWHIIGSDENEFFDFGGNLGEVLIGMFPCDPIWG